MCMSLSLSLPPSLSLSLSLCRTHYPHLTRTSKLKPNTLLRLNASVDLTQVDYLIYDIRYTIYTYSCYTRILL